MNLIIYRTLKDDCDKKIDLNLKMSELKSLGLFSKEHFPLLYLFDSRNFNKISKNKNFTKEVYEMYLENTNFICFENMDLWYKNYLPRNLISFKERNAFIMTEYYNSNKRPINIISQLQLDPLICEYEKPIDWFVNDDETLNFLMNMENLEFESQKNIFVKGDIYFQDKLPYISLDSKDYKLILINIIINEEVNLI